MTGPSVWGWQPPRRTARLLLGLPSPTVSVRGRPVRGQEGALWCLLKRQVSLHVCRQGSWEREAGAGCTLRPGGGTRECGRPGGAARGWHQSVRSPWGVAGGRHRVCGRPGARPGGGTRVCDRPGAPADSKEPGPRRDRVNCRKHSVKTN